MIYALCIHTCTAHFPNGFKRQLYRAHIIQAGLCTGSMCLHQRIRLDNHRQLSNEVSVRLHSWVRAHVNVVVRPAQNHVQIGICNGELVAHQIVTTLEQFLLYVCEFRTDLCHLPRERALTKVGMNFAGEVV